MPTPQSDDRIKRSIDYVSVVNKLRSNRDKIAKLPVEQQLNVYGVAFDRYMKPHLAGTLKDEKSFNIAKDRWIHQVVDPSNKTGTAKPLPSDFGVVPPETSRATTGSAALVGAVAGMEGAAKNIVSFTDRVFGKDASQDSWVKGLNDAEASDYQLAHGVAPKAAATGAAVGKAVPNIEAFMAGEGVVPEFAKGTPIAYRLLSRAAKTAVGTAVASTTDEKPTGKQVAEQAVANTALDLLLHGMGKVGAKGASRLINTAKASGSTIRMPQGPPIAVGPVATQVEDLIETIRKEKFPAKPLDQLGPAEFDSVVQEAKARRAASEAQAKEAAKGVADAKKAPKLSKEEQIVKKQADILAKQKQRKADGEKAIAFHKKVVEYRKRTGSIPTPDSEHFKQLVDGKTVDEILGTPEDRAVKTAVASTENTKAETLAQGSPTAVEALNVVQSVAKKTPKVKPEPLFKIDVERLKNAKTPEEFASAKKDALAEIEGQAREKAKSGSDADKKKLLSEYTAARERVRSHPVPEGISKKALDAKRKAAEHAEGTRALADATEKASSNPESDLATAIDRSKELVVEYKRLGSDNGLSLITKAWKKQSPGGDLKVFNEMMETAVAALKKGK